MTLADMKLNKIYEISKINTNDSVLRERFVALGICKGSYTTLLEKSVDKSTIAIMANNTRIAMRMTEAKEVSVKELA